MSTAKRELRRRLAREQRTIGTRLAEAVGPNLAGPVLGRARIGYELAERSRGVAHGGMGMIARLVAEVDGGLATGLVRPRPDKPSSSGTPAGIIGVLACLGHGAREDQRG